MAAASMKDIKRRIRSVESTMQITKAMQLVASSKLRGARNRMEASRPYLQTAQRMMQDLKAHNTGTESDILLGRDVKRRCIVVVAGDRGLAGSYNANVLRLAEANARDVETIVMPMGKKANEYFQHRSFTILESGIEKVDGTELDQCDHAASLIVYGFMNGDFDEVLLAYTTFVNVLIQKPQIVKLLPIEAAENPNKSMPVMIFEPGVDSLLKHYLPQYLSGLLYAAICDAVASEQAARRVAMDSATQNAADMIDALTLRYNRARQSSITQELTEIVAGAEH